MPHTIVLTAMFLLAYFTHLVGFVVAFLGALFICLAAVPSCLLTMYYFEQTGFFEQGAGRRLVSQPLALLQGGHTQRDLTEIGAHVLAMDRELFEHHAGPRAPLSLFFLCIFVVLAAVTITEYCCRPWREPARESDDADHAGEPDAELSALPHQQPGPGLLFPILLGLLMLVFYLLLANHLGTRGGPAHGGFLKARLVLLPPLLWLACLRESASTSLRITGRALVVALLGVNLFLVTRTFAAENETLDRFTAGIEAVGRGRRLAAIGNSGGSRLANPLTGAHHYYCLGTDNITVANYEAGTPHFPIMFRQGTLRPPSADADAII